MPSPKAAKAAPTSTAAMADELGALQKEYDLALAPFEHKLPRMKALREALQAACTAPSDKEWITEGARFGVRLGPRAAQRSIDIPALVKKIGAAVFTKFATCTLRALEDHVPVDVVALVVSEDQTGPRKLTTFEKGVVG